MTFVASAHSVSGNVPHAQTIRAGKHTVVADEPEPLGGKDAGVSPFGLLLSSLAACTAITLEMYAARKGWTLGTIRVDLRMFEDEGKRRIERVLRFSAPLDDAQRARAVEIAGKTPVTKTLLPGVAIETTVSEA